MTSGGLLSLHRWYFNFTPLTELQSFLYLWNNSLLGHVHYNLSFCDSEDLVELVLRQPPNREAGTITFELGECKDPQHHNID